MSPKIHARFWTDPDLEGQTPEVRLTLLWMMTNPNLHFAGVFQLTRGRFQFETGLEANWLDQVLRELPTMFVRAGEWVWIRSFIRHQFGQGEALARNNLAKALARSVATFPEEIGREIWATYPELKGLASPPKPSEGVGKGLASPSLPGLTEGSPSKGLASPSQFRGPNDLQRAGEGNSERPSEGLPKPSEGQVYRNINISNSEGGTGGNFAEAEIPSLREVLAFCASKTPPIPEAIGIKFWTHYEKTAYPAWTVDGRRFQWRGKLETKWAKDDFGGESKTAAGNQEERAQWEAQLEVEKDPQRRRELREKLK